MRVLLVRADGIGDALACAPLVAALRAAGHEVGAVLGTRNRAAFAPDAFARVHVLERIPWPDHGSTPASRARAIAEASVVGYDVALVASEELDAYTFARDAAIPIRVGFVNALAKPLKTIVVRPLLTHALARPASASAAREHEVETLFALGAGFVDERVPTRDVARLRALVIGEDADYRMDARRRSRRPAIAIQTSRKHARAGLDRDAFVACARALRARGDEVVVLGDDAALAYDVARASDARTDGSLDVGAWKSRIANARALVTGDSGAAHVAGMTGIPTVDAFALGPATAYDVRRWSPWAARRRTLVLDPTRPAAHLGRVLVEALDDVLAA